MIVVYSKTSRAWRIATNSANTILSLQQGFVLRNFNAVPMTKHVRSSAFALTVRIVRSALSHVSTVVLVLMRWIPLIHFLLPLAAIVVLG